LGAIIHINGWPGVGKLTIARLLAAQIGAKLMANHTMLNPAEALFSRADPLYRSLRRTVRQAVLDHIVRMPPDVSIVFTDALSDDEFDRAVFDDYVALAEQRGNAMLSIVLDCEAEENARRLAASGRAELHKLVRPHVLAEMRQSYNLLRAAHVDRIDLDVTRLTAEDAAASLARALEGARAAQAG
jgi:deoxyadenosine/deoxycytidine kinase